MKICGRCHQEKPLDAFSPSARVKPGRWCRDCYREYNAARYQVQRGPEREAYGKAYREANRDRLREYNRQYHAANPRWRLKNRLASYGLTIEQYEQLLAIQDGRCFICRREAEKTSATTARLHVDHDHKTGRVRGLLCNRCNTALGYLAEDPERMQRMIEYITRGRS